MLRKDYVITVIRASKNTKLITTSKYYSQPGMQAVRYEKNTNVIGFSSLDLLVRKILCYTVHILYHTIGFLLMNTLDFIKKTLMNLKKGLWSRNKEQKIVSLLGLSLMKSEVEFLKHHEGTHAYYTEGKVPDRNVFNGIKFRLKSSRKGEPK